MFQISTFSLIGLLHLVLGLCGSFLFNLDLNKLGFIIKTCLIRSSFRFKFRIIFMSTFITVYLFNGMTEVCVPWKEVFQFGMTLTSELILALRKVLCYRKLGKEIKCALILIFITFVFI